MMQNVLLAGYSRQNITPDRSVPISGYGNELERMSEGVLDDVYTTCVAITSGEETILICCSDIIGYNNEMLAMIRTAITEATGIPGQKVFFSASHTHSAPAPYLDAEPCLRFRKELAAAAAVAAKEALADREEAKLLTTTKRIAGMNFIRHYLMGDGTYCGSNFGSTESGFAGHAGMTDPRMILVQLKRSTKPAIVLMNWQAHNDNAKAVGFRNLSSSYVGKIREKFEAETGMLFSYICGASGNQNPGSRIDVEKHGLDWIQYGHKMADHVISALPKLEEVEGTAIKTLRVDLEVSANHAWDHMVEKAQEVKDFWFSTADRAQATALARTYGMTSCYHAGAILRLAQLPPTITLELNAFTIGELAFVTSTNEAFSDVGLYVRAYAPYDTVVFCAGNCTYLPCATAYDYRSYEADTSLYAKGSCEKVSWQLCQMLQELKNA